MAVQTRLEAGSDGLFGNKALTTSAQMIVDRRSNRVSLVIRNAAATDIFWGFSSAVTVANGYPLKQDEEQVFDDYRGQVWAISATTGDLRWAEVH